MDLALLGSLAVLALIDSTSFGTLLIPIWLMLTPGPVRATRMLVFLGTVATFYLVVGLAVAVGADAGLPWLTSVLKTRAATWAQLVIGVALFFLSFRLDRKKPANPDSAEPGRGDRLARWRSRVMTEGESTVLAGERSWSARVRHGGVRMVVLGLTAAGMEVGTMLPYLAAIGLIATSALSAAEVTVVLAGYCLLMITPALGLLALRLALKQRIEPVLGRISGWLANSTALAWVVGIVGFLLARDAAIRLGLIGG